MDEIQRFLGGLSNVTAKLLHKDPPAREMIVYDEVQDSGELFEALFYMLKNNDLCGAEDFLFKILERDYSDNKYYVGMEFYAAVKEMTDAQLTGCNFPRSEIETGEKALEAVRVKALNAMGELPPVAKHI